MLYGWFASMEWGCGMMGEGYSVCRWKRNGVGGRFHDDESGRFGIWE